MTNFKQEVASVRASMPKAKGAYGMRHISRGMTGFYEKANAGRRPVAEYVGLGLLDHLLSIGMEDEAEILFEQLGE